MNTFSTDTSLEGSMIATGPDERLLAKQHWASTSSQRREYPENAPPFYARSLARTIKSLNPTSVVEMGCNAGRNLRLLQKILPQNVSLSGFDVNSSSIEFGRGTWGLDLVAADEHYLNSLAENSIDLLFTVSVLDHVPELDVVMEAISRTTGRFLVLVEPYPEQQLRYLDSFKEAGTVRPTVTTATPYSYLYDYTESVPRFGFDLVFDIPMPTYTANWGPLYRLNVFVKRGYTADINARIDWRHLTNEILFDAAFSTYPVK